VHGLPLPDDESRVATITGETATPLHLGSNGDHNIVFSPEYAGTLEVTFRTKPWGLMGNWHTTQEYIQS
jgi:hypothetical protein